MFTIALLRDHQHRGEGRRPIYRWTAVLGPNRKPDMGPSYTGENLNPPQDTPHEGAFHL